MSVHKNLQVVVLFGQMDPIHAFPSCMFRSTLTLCFIAHIPLGLTQKTLCTSLFLHACYFPYPSQSPPFDRSNISQGVQIIKLLIQFCPASRYFVLLTYKYLCTPILENSSVSIVRQKFHVHIRQWAKLYLCVFLCV